MEKQFQIHVHRHAIESIVSLIRVQSTLLSAILSICPLNLCPSLSLHHALKRAKTYGRTRRMNRLVMDRWTWWTDKTDGHETWTDNFMKYEVYGKLCLGTDLPESSIAFAGAGSGIAGHTKATYAFHRGLNGRRTTIFSRGTGIVWSLESCDHWIDIKVGTF